MYTLLFLTDFSVFYMNDMEIDIDTWYPIMYKRGRMLQNV